MSNIRGEVGISTIVTNTQAVRGTLCAHDFRCWLCLPDSENCISSGEDGVLLKCAGLGAEILYNPNVRTTNGFPMSTVEAEVVGEIVACDVAPFSHEFRNIESLTIFGKRGAERMELALVASLSQKQLEECDRFLAMYGEDSLRHRYISERAKW